MARLCTQCREPIPTSRWPRCPNCGYIHPNPTPIVKVDKAGVVKMKVGESESGPLFRVCNVDGHKGLAVWDRVARAERFFDITAIDALVRNYCEQ